MARHIDVTASFELSHDMTMPAVTLQTTTGASESVKSELLDAVPAGFKVEWREVEFSTDTLDHYAFELDQALSGKSESLWSRAILALEEQGARPVEWSHAGWEQHFTLLVDHPARDEVPNLAGELEQLVAEQLASTTPQPSPVLRIDFGSEPTPLTGRLNAPGQAMAGNKVWFSDGYYSSPCTGGFSAKIGSGSYVMSAGHCVEEPGYPNRTHMSHRSSSGGETFYGYATRFDDVQGNGSTIWRLDYSFATRSTTGTGKGIPSPYVRSINSSGVDDIVAVTGLNTSDETSSARYLCYDGASSYRDSEDLYSTNPYRRLCGYTQGRSSSGSVIVNNASCIGDSGGPVYAVLGGGATAYGLISSTYGSGKYTEHCYHKFTYSRIYPALLAEGGSLITASSSFGDSMLQSALPGQVSCVAAYGSGLANYTKYHLWNCLQDNPAEVFSVEPVPSSWGYGGDAYQLVRYDGSRRTCVSVNQETGNPSTWLEAKIHVWTCKDVSSTSHLAQVWRFKYSHSTADDTLHLSPVLAPTMCLSVYGSLNQNGTDLHLWTCGTTSAGKQWSIR